MRGVLRSMLQKLNAYCISRRPMACLKARKMDDNERAVKKIANRQLRYQQLPMEGSAMSPDGGSVLAELASVSSTPAGITDARKPFARIAVGVSVRRAPNAKPST